jgi:hypothetical protein
VPDLDGDRAPGGPRRAAAGEGGTESQATGAAQESAAVHQRVLPGNGKDIIAGSG